MASTSSQNSSSERNWYQRSPEEVVDHWQTDPDDGLTDDEARRRLEKYGPNEVETGRTTPWWRILIKQFLDPLIYILVLAALVALYFQEYVDAGVIAAILIINAAIGFIQELRARQAILSLAELTTPKAHVVRDGRSREIDSRQVVPGDLIVLQSGVRVPADARLVETRELAVDESALTGESTSVGKQTGTIDDEHLVAGDQLNMAFSTTTVARGRGRGVVVATGADTELGHIASSMRDVVETRAPIQEKVRTLSHWIGAAIAVFTVIVVVVGWAQQRETTEIVGMSIAMAVAAIPEALPIVLTVTLAVGVRRMAERNAITRSLPAVETLGSTTVIGSDKTGTLTMNEMTVKSIWAGGREYEVEGTGYGTEGDILRDGQAVHLDDEPGLRNLLLAGLLANEAPGLPEEDGDTEGDPTELALLVAAEKAGLSVDECRSKFKKIDDIPFESERRYMASLHEDTDRGKRRIYLKGSPEAVLNLCDRQMTPDGIDEIERDEALDKAEELADRGYRVLAMAYHDTDVDEIHGGELESTFVFAGFQAKEDPLRPEAVESVKAAKKAGVRVIMLTGDHASTARAIGSQLGLGDGDANVCEGRTLETMDDAEVDRTCTEVDVFARVAPEHKLRIVQRLKEQGEIVAVTGDGVNDAPALRAAHLGVAMGKKGTDVAREASDMVLSDDNFASITAAVEEGRVVFNNIRKVTYFLLSTGVGLVLAIMLALFFGWPLPFVAVQVLWINLVTKGLQDVSLAFEPGEPGQLDMPPRPPKEGVFHRPVLIRMITIGAFLGAVTLAVFWWAYQSTGDLILAQTIAMTQMVIFQFFHVGNCRSLHRSVFTISPFTNKALFLAVGAALIAHIAILYISPLQTLFQTAPLTLEHWAYIVAISLSIVVVAELDKWLLRRRGYGPGLARPQRASHTP